MLETNHSEMAMPLVLIVDDEPLMRLQLKRAMKQLGYQVAEATNGAECLDLYVQLSPDLVLLDALMPVMDGFTCCTKLQTLPTTEQVYPAPVLMITALESEESVERAFESGAVDYVTKPIHWAVLNQRVRRLIAQAQLQQQQALLQQQLQEANLALQRLANTDSLTGLANRRCFDEHFAQEWRRMAREKQPLSLILCDVDFFKHYNDTYGHQAGDRCLMSVAKAISSSVKRSSDLAARYGGEEFAVILPNTDEVGAAIIAEAICTNIRALNIAHSSSNIAEHVTLSLGVATMVPRPQFNSELFFTASDAALYRAKDEGRDRYCVQSSASFSSFMEPLNS
ncbi:PleD family two-component system response regulator [Phormidium sp. FACHB-592]|uniref:PleD family two-component system response regulator n=1 Tax=Stenomitos frigidus AS-A4 TaxID=2933935 RepID=A0ABV0KPG6_9CYAN|nr:PleD family two-component system response regulator [Phormidium sp. FACHB-592]MBD2074958.1 PleD family two-component system response regulator [Phormidium sp. FACHB-592]